MVTEEVQQVQRSLIVFYLFVNKHREFFTKLIKLKCATILSEN